MTKRVFILSLLVTVGLAILCGCGCICDGKRPWMEPRRAEESPSIPSGGPITLLHPNGDEIWREGSVQTVRWETATEVRVDSVSVFLKLEIDPESPIRYVRTPEYRIVTVPGNPGEWTWNRVGWMWNGSGPYCGNYRIEVRGHSREKIRLVDRSDGPFTIACDRDVSDPLKPESPNGP